MQRDKSDGASHALLVRLNGSLLRGAEKSCSIGPLRNTKVGHLRLYLFTRLQDSSRLIGTEVVNE